MLCALSSVKCSWCCRSYSSHRLLKTVRGAFSGMWGSVPTKCKICTKAVYAMDPQIDLDGSKFHRHCAKCKDCNCQINLLNFNKNETPDLTFLLCKTHYFQRFNEGGGCYLGDEKYKSKQGNRSMHTALVTPVVTPLKEADLHDLTGPQTFQVEITPA